MSTALLYGTTRASSGNYRRECSRCPQLLAPTSDRDMCGDCIYVLGVKARPDFTFGPVCARPDVSVSTAYCNYKCRCDARCKPWHEARKAQKRADYKASRG